MRSRFAPLLFLLPAFVAMGAIVLWPLVQTIALSLTNYNPAITTQLSTGLSLERDENTGEISLHIERDSPADRAGLTPETEFAGLFIPPDPATGRGDRLETFSGDAQRRLQRMRRSLERAESRALEYPASERSLTLCVADGDASREVVLRYEPAPVRRVPLPDLGLSAAHIASENRWQLLVRPGYPADRAGITQEDTIVAVQGVPLEDLSQLESRLTEVLEVTQERGPIPIVGTHTVVLSIRRADDPDALVRKVLLPGHRGPFTLDPPPDTDPEIMQFVGFQNYADILIPTEHSNEAHDFYRYLIHTIIWTVTNVTLHFILGLGLALLLNRDIRGRVIYRILLLLPWAVPVFVSAFVWRFLFNQQGVINAGLGVIGIDPIPWLSSTGWTMTACIVVNVWLGVPFMMTVLLGGLQSIPDEMMEAAVVDGASRWQRFWHVTLPLLKPVAVTATLLGVIWTFNMFNVIYLMQGRDGRQVEILATLAFRRFYVNSDYGLAAAHGVLILSLLLAFAWAYLRALKAHERVWQ
ncbi:ABC transporter permease subunit [Candidatus Sumerlaeota bacterium]|nr:ABC transporter permease subunit [Candidatus Sumerlaeota bacterium]